MDILVTGGAGYIGSVLVEELVRRPGDPRPLVASSKKIRQELGWRPRYPDLRDIVQGAWEWHRTHPYGYGDWVSYWSLGLGSCPLCLERARKAHGE